VLVAFTADQALHLDLCMAVSARLLTLAGTTTPTHTAHTHHHTHATTPAVTRAHARQLANALTLDQHLLAVYEELEALRLAHSAASGGGGGGGGIGFVTHRANLVRVMLSAYGKEEERLRNKWSIKVNCYTRHGVLFVAYCYSRPG
jgi:hypothetical protein